MEFLIWPKSTLYIEVLEPATLYWIPFNILPFHGPRIRVLPLLVYECYGMAYYLKRDTLLLKFSTYRPRMQHIFNGFNIFLVLLGFVGDLLLFPWEFRALIFLYFFQELVLLFLISNSFLFSRSMYHKSSSQHEDIYSFRILESFELLLFIRRYFFNDEVLILTLWFFY